MISQHKKDSSQNMKTAPDEVIPARFWDTNDVFQKLVMEFTYRFDDVLEAGKGSWRSESGRTWGRGLRGMLVLSWLKLLCI
jgi:hypothetical protein